MVNYTVSDGLGGSDVGQLTITVHGQNDAPVAVDDTASGNEDTTISGSVAGNDSDVDDGASLSYALNGPAPAGLTVNLSSSNPSVATVPSTATFAAKVLAATAPAAAVETAAVQDTTVSPEKASRQGRIRAFRRTFSNGDPMNPANAASGVAVRMIPRVTPDGAP